tara:strand:+ start:36438 stop:37820 length:1383 start_codon:yes stop_codon:yes gene_type:complete
MAGVDRNPGDDSAEVGQSGLTDLSQAIDRSNWSRFQLRVFCLVGLAIILDGFDNQLLGFALPALLAEWELEKSAVAPVLSFTLIGMTCGAAIAGTLGDRFGRKNILIFCVALFGFATILSSLSESLTMLGATRIIAALGLGGAMPNAIALIAEYTPSKSRALAVSFVAVCVPLGGFVGGFVSAAVLPVMGWRALFLIGGAAPVAFAIILVFLLPESPAYVLRQENGQDRVAALLRRMGLHIRDGERFVDHVSSATTGSRRKGAAALFSPALRRDTIALGMAFLASLFAVYACFNWLPTLMTQQGHDLATASMALTMFNLGGVIAALFGGWAADRFGTRLPLSVLAASIIGSAALLALLPLGKIAMLIVLMVMGAGIAGSQSVLTALAAHVYPTHLRSTGVGISIGFGRLGGILSAFVGAYVLAYGGGPAFFWTIALAGLFAMVAINVVSRHSASRVLADA